MQPCVCEQMHVNEADLVAPHISCAIISYTYEKEQELKHGIALHFQSLNIYILNYCERTQALLLLPHPGS